MAMFQSSPFQLDQQPMMGDESAPVTVVKFGDYQCGHCKTWDAEVKPQLKQEYIESGEVKFYYINFPVIGENSRVAARAGEYVLENDAENYWAFHDTLYGVPTGLTPSTIISVATETTNITETEIEEGLNSQNTLNELQTDRRVGNGNGVSATPTIFVNGERVGNDYQSLKTAIEKQLPDEQ
jgi:protein-disulfide isomerase